MTKLAERIIILIANEDYTTESAIDMYNVLCEEYLQTPNKEESKLMEVTLNKLQLEFK